jgi:CheY-like chemotaxis protein
MVSGDSSGKIRVLVVEDDALSREALAYAFKTEGYSVSCAENGKRGLDLLHKSPRPSAILLDLGLPVIDGYEFIRRQKQDPEVSDIPVIVMTGSWSPSVPEAAVILRKPFDLRQLIGIVGDCCQARSGVRKH